MADGEAVGVLWGQCGGGTVWWKCGGGTVWWGSVGEVWGKCGGWWDSVVGGQCGGEGTKEIL